MLRSSGSNYARGSYAAAQQSADAFLRHFPSSPAADEAYYLRGLARVRLGHREEARADFVAGAAAADRDDLRAYCQAMLGNLAYDDGDMKQALGHYATALPGLPTAPPTDEIVYRYGVCLQRAGRWNEARHVFSRLLDQFGKSRQAAAARRRFAWRHEYFAIACGAFRCVDDADRAVADMKRKGLDASPEFGDVDGQAMWRLLTGQYVMYEQAQADLPRIRQIEPSATIVP